MLSALSFSQEIRDFCSFSKLPDAAKITRFKQDFCDYLENFFNRLVDITEPICRKLDENKANYLIFDIAGFEIPVFEIIPNSLTLSLNKLRLITRRTLISIYSILNNRSLI